MEAVVEYEKLLPYQFEQRMQECPLVYVPVGALEWHGEHLALGNDSIKMRGLCSEAARLGGGVVFPAIYYGIPGMVNYGGGYNSDANMPMTHEFLANLLATTLTALEKVGFKAAILITGHTCNEQIDLVKDVAEKYEGSMKVCGTNDAEWGDAVNHTSDHAAKWETSILWYLRPELVDIYRLPRDTDEPLDGIYGDDPRVHASRELGKQAVEAIAKDLAALGKKLLA